ncbi:hemolysin family protein [Endomicrobium proavitum]|uniref:Magnesium/cobalt efflux protein n=1 Tax=Endomicrobium proavitum TaxID=1408281 RepID=A0A0G3WKK1_9BACT|nr:hemolysin family protein [Endomicrobium proavitum]AKL97979.1 magnesium/cobalt efflux protein [Endomicrobium proavitum]
MSIIIILKIILFVLLLITLGVFNGSETAITSLSGAHLKRLKISRPKSASFIAFWETNTYEVMTAVIIGINLIVVGMGVVCASLAPEISRTYKISLRAVNVALPAVSIILALVLGNIFPKTYARYNAEKVSAATLPLIVRFAKVFAVVVRFLSGISNEIMKFLPKRKESRSVKADEIDFLLSNENTSPLEKDARKLVSNIMDFAERRVSQVMIPRQGIFAVDIAEKKEDLINKIVENKYSRIPIHRENLNNILGIIYSKDLAVALRNSEVIVFEDLIRPVYYVPESAQVSEVLKEFKTGHQHIAVVVDEFGSTVGIVSIEDLLEEIVGEVFDEYDSDIYEKNIMPYGDNAYLVQAQESVLNINKEIDINIPEEESYSTLGGWLLEVFGKIPKRGEKTAWNNYEIEIQDADNKKINVVVIRKSGVKN